MTAMTLKLMYRVLTAGSMRRPGLTEPVWFSAKKYMVVKYAPAPSVEELVGAFPEVDVILLEGFKYSEYPKIEVIRKGNSSESVCDPKNLLGIVTDLTKAELDVNGEMLDIPLLGLEETERLTDYLLSKMVIDSK